MRVVTFKCSGKLRDLVNNNKKPKNKKLVSNLIFFGTESLLCLALDEYVVHYHEERYHQGKGNALLFPADDYDPANETGTVKCRERLGGMLKYYYRDAA